MNTGFKSLSITAVLVLAGGLGTGPTAAQGLGHHPGAATANQFANVRVLSFEQLERIAAREVPHITELEIKDLTLKVKGYDAQGMKLDVLLDRRDGYVLSRRVKYPKHMQRYAPAGAIPPVITR
ncbi:hypothetical protein FQY83_16965 [Luteimonas marina]|uniref:PepSY domain-containing protein n=1 Tax=Luteimonas marina TaxID=488485 RepID=A0A5C5TTA5_9GAMM|nr:hypothetical protein [Luteimonas marina]TWT17461.1 hypothetical protein FQY83_16965 [Luteimonas marina]